MDKIEKFVRKLAEKVLNSANQKLTQAEIVSAFKKGIDNAIYNYPRKTTSSYRRTGNLKKAVRLTRLLPGPARPDLKISITVNDDILRRLYNPGSKNRPYGKFIAFDKTDLPRGGGNNTVKGLGWYPLARKSVMDFIVKDALKNGVI